MHVSENNPHHSSPSDAVLVTLVYVYKNMSHHVHPHCALIQAGYICGCSKSRNIPGHMGRTISSSMWPVYEANCLQSACWWRLNLFEFLLLFSVHSCGVCCRDILSVCTVALQGEGPVSQRYHRGSRQKNGQQSCRTDKTCISLIKWPSTWT